MTADFALPQQPVSRAVSLASLTRESLRHPVLQHPWIEALQRGTLPDPDAALCDFAWLYHGYRSWFPRYLLTAMDSLDRLPHQRALMRALEEEHGCLESAERDDVIRIGVDPEEVEGVCCTELLRRFSRAAGVKSSELEPPGWASVRWRTRFLAYLEQATPAESVGALGLGTGHILAPLYRRLLAGFRSFSRLQEEDLLFFRIHGNPDGRHSRSLIHVAGDLVHRPGAARELRHGMLTALDMRCDFFDTLYLRAFRGVSP